MSARVLPLLLALTLGGADPLLGTPLRQDGYTLRPPAGFRMVRMDPFRGTHAGAVGLTGEASAFLSAALVDGPGPQAAAMLVSVVDGPFEATPAMRDDFSAAVARHFREELGLEYAMETAERVTGIAPRIEVLGTVRQEGQLRYVLVAAMEGQGRHAVVTVSAPSGRWASLASAVRAALDSFEDGLASRTDPRGVAGAAAGVMLGALALSITVWRRRRATPR